MVKSFKESHTKDLGKLTADRQSESEKKVTDDLLDTPKRTVLSMTGLTSAVWTLGMFQMVTGESCQCIRLTKQKETCHTGVRHVGCTVPKCGFVIRYQNTSNLEQYNYIRGGLDHKELAGRLTVMQQLERGVQSGTAADVLMTLSHTCNAPAFTAEKKVRCHIKFVKWRVRKNRVLTMPRQDDELNEIIDKCIH
jgi:hypothetical protein